MRWWVAWSKSIDYNVTQLNNTRWKVRFSEVWKHWTNGGACNLWLKLSVSCFCRGVMEDTYHGVMCLHYKHFSRPSLYFLSIIFATTVFNSQWLPSVCVCVLIVMIWVWTYSYFCISKHTKGWHTSSDNLQDVIIIKCYFHAYLPQRSNQRHGINFLIDLLVFFSIFFSFLLKFVEIKSWIFFFLFYVWICSLLP